MSARPRQTQPNFDRIARPYRWIEYLILGRALESCRLRFLAEVDGARRALVLGDGDGRFLAHLLARNPHIRVDAVDLSAAMLRLLTQRCQAPATQLRIHHTDARSFEPGGPYDLVVTHFFLDCLSDPELHALTARLRPHLAPEALWIVSEFRIPTGPMRWPARIFVRLLYLAFRVLTGLRVTRLPDYASALGRVGLCIVMRQTSLFGVLTSELWRRHPIGPAIHPSFRLTSQGASMTTPFPIPPSPVPNIPEPPSTDLPSHPVSDPIPDPEPPSPSLAQPDAAVFRRA